MLTRPPTYAKIRVKPNIKSEVTGVSSFGINVFDFGAKGDGIHDDTAAIQAAINYTAERGGGKILFPYTKGGYRIASPAIEEYEGKPLRAQLMIPPGSANIMLEGEMPPRILNAYMVIKPEWLKLGRKTTRFVKYTGVPLGENNVRIFSDWEAPEERDGTKRPYSIIAAPEGDMLRGKFSVFKFNMKNLDFRAPMNTDKMYPTQGCANLQNVSRVHITDCQFALSESVGDTILGKELQPNPTHVAGVILSGDQNDNNILRNVCAQGFRYGIVAGENVVAESLTVLNCEEAITFHDASHLTSINHIVAQHNTVIISTTDIDLYGMPKGPCNVRIGAVNFEAGIGHEPKINALKYGVKDTDGRLHGELKYHAAWGENEFPTLTTASFKAERF